MQPREQMPIQPSHSYKKLLIVVGILLVIISSALLVWFLFKNKVPKRQVLTEEQQQVIVQQLNTIAQEEPLTQKERYQLITGRELPEAKSSTSVSATTAQTSPKKSGSKNN